MAFSGIPLRNVARPPCQRPGRSERAGEGGGSKVENNRANPDRQLGSRAIVRRSDKLTRTAIPINSNTRAAIITLKRFMAAAIKPGRVSRSSPAINKIMAVPITRLIGSRTREQQTRVAPRQQNREPNEYPNRQI